MSALMNRSSDLGRLAAKDSRRREAARRPRGRARHAKLHLLEFLEDRVLLAGTAQFDYVLFDPRTGAVNSDQVQPLGLFAPYGFTAQQIRSAYGINAIRVGSVTGNGAGQTIAIVDAYDDPDLVSTTASHFLSSDLHAFDSAMRVPDPPSFLKLDEHGGTSYPSASAGNGWSIEESLDVEWAHAVAPLANIVLIEANSASWNDLATAVSTAVNRRGVSVVSMSWGAADFAGEASLDPLFTTPAGHAGVTFVASAGDDGAPGGYPAFSTNVVAVGGTTLTAPGGVYKSETAWSLNNGSGTGGGQSSFEPEPSYQTRVQQSGWRQMPDVAFDAGPTSGVAVYDSYDGGTYRGTPTPWLEAGGTSLSAPCWAGLIGIADQLRASRNLPALDGPTQTLPALYQLPAADFHDITSGNNRYPAGPGYDMCTGLGSPVGNKLVPALASFSSPSDLVTASASTAEPAFGQSITFTATVLGTPGSGTPTGTVTFRHGSLILGTASLNAAGQASINAPALNAGNYTITAAYGGDSQLPANSTLVVVPVSPDSTTTTVNASSTTSTFGQQVTLTATVTAAPLSAATPTGTVTFLSGRTVVGTAALTGGIATCTTQTLPAGTDVVTAVYSGGLNFAGSTSALIGPASTISVVAGKSGFGGGDTGDGGPATEAALYFPVVVAVDTAGDIFIGETCGSRIREVNHSTGVITTIAGNGTFGDTGDGGPATSAEIGWPSGLVVGAGNLYFSDACHNIVRKVNLTTGVITTVAGNPKARYIFGGDGGPAAAAELWFPTGLAVDPAGDLFIADNGNGRVREVNHATGVITTVAGNGGMGYGGDGGPATSAELDGPESLGFDAAGDLFILDDLNLNNSNVGANVREVNHATRVISTVAGDNAPGWNSSGDGGPATAAQLGNAAAMAVDASGDLFIDERWGNNVNGGVIRELNHATGVITAVAGNGGNEIPGGPAASAYLCFPSGIALDANGDLFIADVQAGVIDEVQHASLSVTVSQAIRTLTGSDPGATYNGSPLVATAQVSGVVSGVDSSPASTLERVSPTLTYYAGSSVNGTGSTTPPSGAGNYTVVATLPASPDYAPASGQTSFTIAQGRPLLQSSVARPVITAGQAVVLVATVTSGVGAPTGSVTLFDGQTPIGTVTLVNGLATLSVSSLGVGAHSISARYNGSTQVESSRPTVLTVTVMRGGHPGRPATGKVALALRQSAPVSSAPVPLGPLSVIRVTRDRGRLH